MSTPAIRRTAAPLLVLALALSSGCGSNSNDGPTGPDCQKGETPCGGKCVDLQSNSKHCGKCGRSCPAGVPLCRSGACTCIEPEQKPCGDKCVNISDNIDHCGKCGNACPGGHRCENGTCEELTVIEETIRQTNRVRSSQTNCAKAGIMPAADPVTGNAELHRAAQMHADSMARNSFFSHTYPPPGCNAEANPSCHDFAWRIRQTDYQGQPVGENIARGHDSPAAVVQGWKTSKEGHCQIMMSQRATEIGIGFARGPGGPYWVQVFGRQ